MFCFCVRILLQPGESFILAAQNCSLPSDRPSIFIIQELNAQDRSLSAGGDRGPGFASIAGAKNQSLLTHCPALLIVAKVNVVDRLRCSRFLDLPCLAGIFCVKYCPTVTDNPTPFVADEVDMN